MENSTEYIFEQTVQDEVDLETEGNEEKEVLEIYKLLIQCKRDSRSTVSETRRKRRFFLVEGIGLEDSNQTELLMTMTLRI